MSFDMNKAWNEATGMIGANREVLVIIAGLFFFIPNAIISMIMPGLPEGFGGTEQDFAQLEAVMGEFYAGYWWLMILIVLAMLIGWLSLLVLLRDESKPTVAQAITRGGKGALTALAAIAILMAGLVLVLAGLGYLSTASGSSAVGLLVFFATLFVLIGLNVRMTLLTAVIAVDDARNPIQAIRRSWDLTKGNSFRLFAFLALIAIVYMVLSLLAGIVLLILLFVAGETAGMVLGVVLGGIVSAAVMVIMVAVTASIHRQLTGPSHKQVRANFE